MLEIREGILCLKPLQDQRQSCWYIKFMGNREVLISDYAARLMKMAPPAYSGTGKYEIVSWFE